jgi:hypothetical protein
MRMARIKSDRLKPFLPIGSNKLFPIEVYRFDLQTAMRHCGIRGREPTCERRMPRPNAPLLFARKDLVLQMIPAICHRYPPGGDHMARNKLKEAAKTIGSAVGKADRTAHKAVMKATKAAKQELNQLSKQVEGLKKKLQKSTKQLKKALK